jgi:hypothetical protein
VFEGTIDSSAAALSQLTTDDLNFLFSWMQSEQNYQKEQETRKNLKNINREIL